MSQSALISAGSPGLAKVVQGGLTQSSNVKVFFQRKGSKEPLVEVRAKKCKEHFFCRVNIGL